MVSTRSLSRKTHSEQWWAKAPQTVIRCSAHRKVDGLQCRHEAAPGTSVCDEHGAAAKQVRAKAATKLQMAAEDLVDLYLGWASDPSVDMRERQKIVQDVLNRLGYNAASEVLVKVSVDPIEALFQDLAADRDRYFKDRDAEGRKPPVVYDAAQAQLEAREALGGMSFDDLVGGRRDASERPLRVIKGQVVPQGLPPNTVDGGATRPTPEHIRQALEDLL